MSPLHDYSIGFLCLVYLALFIAGAVLSLTPKAKSHKVLIRVVTAVLSIPILAVVVIVGIAWSFLGKEPPTLMELQRDFPSKQADLETILRMSDADSNFSRIAPNFLYRTPEKPNELGQYMYNDPKSGLSKSRWDDYRKIYRRNGIQLGIQRNVSRDAFIMVDSVGLSNRGHVTGYVHCANSAVPDAYRFWPCTVGGEKGSRKSDPDSIADAYSFQRLDDRWYAYDEGPS
jgi:hypothetical protein